MRLNAGHIAGFFALLHSMGSVLPLAALASLQNAYVFHLLLKISVEGSNSMSLPHFFQVYLCRPLNGIVLYPLYLLLATLCLGDSDPLGLSFLTVRSGSPSLYSMRAVVALPSRT